MSCVKRRDRAVSRSPPGRDTDQMARKRLYFTVTLCVVCSLDAHNTQKKVCQFVFHLPGSG